MVATLEPEKADSPPLRTVHTSRLCCAQLKINFALVVMSSPIPIDLDSKGLRLRSQVRIVYKFVSVLNLKTVNLLDQ